MDPDVLPGHGELVRLMLHRPPVPEPQLSQGVPDARPPDPLSGAEPLQHPQAVRRQRHTRADLGQLLCLLMHLDVDPGLSQRNRRRDPAETAADNHRPQSHPRPFPIDPHPAPS